MLKKKVSACVARKSEFSKGGLKGDSRKRASNCIKLSVEARVNSTYAYRSRCVKGIKMFEPKPY